MSNTAITVLDAGGTSRSIDVESVSGGDFRQAVVIGGASTVAAIVQVTNAAPTTSDYGAVVRRPPLALPYRIVTAASNNAASVKASAGVVFRVEVFNVAAYPIYVKFFNKASSPTPGSDSVVYSVECQAGLSAVGVPDGGVAFTTGIAIAVVKGIANSDNTSVAASDAVVKVFYE